MCYVNSKDLVSSTSRGVSSKADRQRGITKNLDDTFLSTQLLDLLSPQSVSLGSKQIDSYVHGFSHNCFSNLQ